MGITIRTMMGAVLVCAAATATAEVTGNVGFATDYRFRGISQTDRDPAIQGGLDLTTEAGFYAGAWASNIQFAGSMELDLYGGFTGAINENLTYDLGYIFYKYPSANDSGELEVDYHEVKGVLAFSGFSVGVHYSPDYTFETGAFWYVFGDYSMPLGDLATLDLHVGLNQFEDEDEYGDFGLGEVGDDDDNYIDYSISLSREQWGLSWGLALVGTDVDDEECFGDTKICEPTAVLSVSRSL